MVCNNGSRNRECPEDLELLITHIDPVIYGDISREPSLYEVGKELRRINPLIRDKSVKKDYEERLKFFRDKQGVLKKLRDYGSTREEIVYSLNHHVKNCSECRRAYDRIADKWVLGYLDFLWGGNSESEPEVLEEVGVEYAEVLEEAGDLFREAERAYIELLREFDWNTLRILNGSNNH